MAEAVIREALKKALIALEQTQDDLARLRGERQQAIAIVGMGCRFPGGASDTERLWNLLRNGVVTARPVPENRWRAESFYSADPDEPGKTHARQANFLDEPVDAMDAPFFNLSAKECDALDPQQRLLLEVSWEALEDAAQDAAALSGTRTGVFVGVSCDDYAQAHRYSGDLGRIDGYSLTGTLLSTAAGRLSYTFGFEGPCIALDTACSSSLVALHLAIRALRSGEADLALAGGVNLLLSPVNFVCSTKIGSISGDGRCKTFDASADGYGRGEGCGMLVLKRESDALRDGDRILALLRGSAINQDGRSNGLTAPNGKAQEKVLQAAMADACLSPQDLSYIEAHGTGTPLGDPIELEAIGRVMSGCERAEPVLIGTLKSNIGHTESASGVAGVLKVVLALAHDELPAHVGMQVPSPEIRWQALPVQVVTQLRAWPRGVTPRRAGVSSFGFSGTNAHVIVEEAPAHEPRPVPPEPLPHLLPLSAVNESALRELAQRYAQHLTTHSEALTAICHTAAAGRTHFACRVAAMGDTADELAHRLERFVASGQGEGCFYGAVDQLRPRVAFLFPGQGSQVAGMGRGLYEREPVFREALDACDALMADAVGRNIVDLLYGADADALTLRQTRYAQPCLFGLGHALCQLYRSWGIEPEFVVGHSAGEYAAACAAGIVELSDSVRLVCERARLLSSLPAGGTMVAVMADASELHETLASLGFEVSVAAINAPGSSVISGREADVMAAVGALEKRGVVARPLSVSHAFHSPLVDPILDEFRKFAGQISYRASRLTSISSVMGKRDGDADFRSADYWADNIRKPVDFLGAVAALAQQGANVFVEIGAAPTLIGLARRTLDNKGLFLASLDPRRDDTACLQQVLAQLYARGLPIHWRGVRASRHAVWTDNPHYPFQRTRHWKQPIVEACAGQSPSAPEHPLLGRQLQSPALVDVVVYEATYTPEHPRFLRDHVIHNRIISPAAAHIALALLAGRRLGEGGVCTLRDVDFIAPLVVADDSARQVQLIIEGRPGGTRSMRLISRTVGSERSWDLHCTGSLSVGAAESSLAEPWSRFEARCTERVEPESVYRRLRASGYSVGSSFRGLQTIQRGAGEALCRLRLPPEGQSDAVDGLHPGIIDALFQGAMAAAEGDVQRMLTGSHVLIPLQAGKVRHYGPLTGDLVCHVETQSAEDLIRCRLTVYVDASKVVLEIDDFVLKRTTGDTLYRSLASAGWRVPAFCTEWRALDTQSISEATARASGPGQGYLVLSDGSALGDALCQHLSDQHVPCTRVVRTHGPSLELERGAPRAIAFLDAGESDQWRAVLRFAFERAETRSLHVVNLWALDAVSWLEPSADVLGSACEELCAHSLTLAQALLSSEFADRTAFVMASAHVWPVSPEDKSLGPVSAALWGLGRTLRLEHPELSVGLVDVEPETRQAGASLLLAAVGQAGGERDFALRHGGRVFVPRLTPVSPTVFGSATSRASSPRRGDDDGRFLQLPAKGVLDELRCEMRPRRSPLPGELEVEVECAGLNFRDVLNALGQYPGKAGPLGFECVGRVTRVGSSVQGFVRGDRVIVLAAPGCMADFVTVDAALVAQAPRGLSAEALVSLPATFLTAAYALHDLGQMQHGEKVLIHAAAGGVGLAAVQLALRAGLTVYATAGSPEKRRLLRALGVHHVFDSRTLDFAESILTETDGAGVDLVLNSLSGQFIDRSVAALATSGRFLELGKRDVWDESRLRAVKPGAAWHAFDLLEVARAEPRRVLALLDSVLSRVAKGELQPLPVTVFTLDQAPAAFRFMAQGRHVGKIALACRPSRPVDAPIARRDSSYLVTGGTGALGLCVGRWLAEADAGQIVLLARGTPSPAAEQAAREMRARGARVVIVRGDVACAADVQTVVNGLSSGELPLRGIFHAAGVLDDAMVTEQSHEHIERVMAPKVRGAWNLHESTRALELDCFVLFASIAGVLGGAGQLNYAAANAFLDGLSHYRRARGLVATSLDWGPWAGLGMAATLDPQRLSSRGLSPLSAEDGLHSLERALRQGLPQPCLLHVDWPHYAEAHGCSESGFLSELVHPGPGQNGTTERGGGQVDLVELLRAALPGQRLEVLVEHLQGLARSVLGYGQGDLVRRTQPLAEQGFDSLMAVEMRNRVSKHVGQSLPASVLFDYPTLERLAQHLLSEVMQLSEIEASASQPAAETPSAEAASDVVSRLERLLNS